jgi:hypothetical protein
MIPKPGTNSNRTTRPIVASIDVVSDVLADERGVVT